MQGAQTSEGCPCGFDLRHEGALRNFEIKSFRRNSSLLQHASDGVDQLEIEQLFYGYIDVHRKRGRAGKFGLPCFELNAGLAKYPVSKRNNKAGILGHRNKSGRKKQAILRMTPAQQGLE